MSGTLHAHRGAETLARHSRAHSSLGHRFLAHSPRDHSSLVRGALAPALLVAGAVALHAVPAITTFGPARNRFLPGLAGKGRADHVALTFDDGPDPASTPLFLDLLAEHGVRATFFLLGAMLERSPDLGRRMVDEGHELAVHGWNHRNLLVRGPQSTVDEVGRTADLIEGLTGRRPRFYRPPYGVFSAAALFAARRAGLQPVLWTGWGEDWSELATSRTVLDTLAPDLVGGATLLLHDSDCTSAPQAWKSALGALPELFTTCAAQGWELGPLAEHGITTASVLADA